jgi:hypothetical protein
MGDDPHNPELLIAVPTPGEAGLLVDALQQHGIRAWFNAEPSVFYKVLPPFEVAVFVPREQIEQAHAALADIRREEADVDWSQVDVGEPDEGPPLRLEPRPERPEPLPPRELVVRGREIFFMILGASLALFVAGHLYFRSFGWQDLGSAAVEGLLWYGCWRGNGCAIVIIVLFATIGAVIGSLLPLAEHDFRFLPQTVFCAAVAILFIYSRSLNALFAYQRIRSHPSPPTSLAQGEREDGPPPKQE